MKSIFISCASLGSGGAERVISVLSTPFANQYDCVKILMWRENYIFYKFDERIEIINIGEQLHSNSLFKKICWFRKYIRKEKPDLVLSFLTPFNILVLISLLFTKTKTIVCERIDPRRYKGISRLLRDLVYTTSDGVLVQTHTVKQYYHSSVRKKIDVIYNPIILDEEKVGCAVKSYKNKRFVSVGRLDWSKNQYFMIDIFGQYANTHPEYVLDIYGEGPEKGNLQKYIDAKGLGNVVTLKGVEKNVLTKIEDAVGFIFTSRIEGMPNALIEAMCLGLPCVSTEVAGAIDLIKSGENGYLVKQGDKETFVECMSIISDNSDKAHEIGIQAANLYDILNVNKISNQWITYINNKI